MLQWLGVAVLIMVVAACDLAAPPTAVAELAGDHHRISLTPIAAGTLVADWRLTVHAIYSPLDDGAPGTTHTSTSYTNCRKSGGVVFVPNLLPCKRTFVANLERRLPARQIRVSGEGLAIDFEPVVEEGGNRYRIRDLYLDYQRCDGDCPEQRLELDLRCYRGEASDEVVGDDLLLRYQRGADAAAEAVECGLTKGGSPGWFERDTVLPLIRSQFGENDYHLTLYLLDYYAGVPTKEGGWLANPLFGQDSFHEFCPVTQPAHGGYERADLRWRLTPADGWDFDPEVEVTGFWRPGGGLCAIWLDGYQSDGEYQYRVRHFYEFTDGEPQLVRSEEPANIERRWRYLAGQPFEYLFRRSNATDDGEREVRYWHKTAAEQWPERMSNQPDLAEFARQQRIAAVLAERIAPLRPKTLN